MTALLDLNQESIVCNKIVLFWMIRATMDTNPVWNWLTYIAIEIACNFYYSRNEAILKQHCFCANSVLASSYLWLNLHTCTLLFEPNYFCECAAFARLKIRCSTAKVKSRTVNFRLQEQISHTLARKLKTFMSKKYLIDSTSYWNPMIAF